MPHRTIPTVSVVMPAYNAEKYLREAIDSILAQTFTDFELIIINDGSTDFTKDIILSYTDQRIRYIENEQNSGICVTLNKGLDAARGRYIARMDSDDISLPRRLEVQVQYMDSHPEIGVAGTDIEIFGDGMKSQVFNFDTNPQVCRSNLIFSATLAHPTALIRKSVLADNHLIYDDYYRGMEDHHLWWQIAQHSEISNVSEVLLRYRQHTSQATRQNTDEEFKNRLRSFTRQRVCDCGAVLNTDEFNALYLYHECIESYDKNSLMNFISACHKIQKAFNKKRAIHRSAQKEVFGRAISFSLDKSGFSKTDAIKYQLLALKKGVMKSSWLMKRLGSMLKGRPIMFTVGK